MRGPQVELPGPAAAKLAELTLARDASLDAGRSAQARANNLPANDAADAMRGMLYAESSRHAEKHQIFSRLLSRCNQWHFELRLLPGTVLETAPPIDVKLGPGETAGEAVAAVRREISGINQQLAAVRSAPTKMANRKEAVITHLARLALRVKPRISFDVQGNARTMWAEDMVAGKDDVLGMLAYFLLPETIMAAFDLDRPDPPDALSLLEKEQRLSELSAALLILERKEAALLNDSILPRSDMNVMAYLGVRIAQAQAAEPEQVEEVA
jgi:hypothetical protein